MERWITWRGRHLLVGDDGKIIKKENDKFKYLPEDDMEAYDKYVEMSDESYYKLTEEERRIINDVYIKTEGSYYFNSALREKQYDEFKDRRKKQIDVMDKATSTYKAKEDMASTRFVDLNFIRKEYGIDIPYYENIDRSLIADKMKNFIGKEYSTNGYTSVSLNESGNGMFNNLAVKMKINMPKGTSMYVANNVGEYEAVLGRNTKMILKDVSFQESKIEGFEKEYGKVLLTYEVK